MKLKRSLRNVLAIALLCGLSGSGYVPLGVGAAEATVNADARTRAQRLKQERAALADAYMMQLHRMAVGAGGGLLPDRTFPFGAENYVNAGANGRNGAMPPTR